MGAKGLLQHIKFGAQQRDIGAEIILQCLACNNCETVEHIPRYGFADLKGLDPVTDCNRRDFDLNFPLLWFLAVCRNRGGGQNCSKQGDVDRGCGFASGGVCQNALVFACAYSCSGESKFGHSSILTTRRADGEIG